ncbi:conserved hypothetical protein [Trichormus variabilis ATCC 29413]|uniref:Uncharacterized protein n=2 Tax=Anabaena variabilis TaxID=264691 RepID=Q3M810_TRIV2|nr:MULTISPECIES: hypothetical protein [Nostocaceae]ABA22876.1 conserved hypothetical protein [Trichormus variabilis ATCC 29413]MBC1212919.1 hypothetical protein [Trichormus variabilis ARAD]MBC1258344.1 hypothetical protein [Trichormus variabilis V5]MBC1268123.1 hypothetical protein [Trichormus variabilis FSR]MBC1303419.1 hypothetical protein [Trichormus variabilis N2B]
MLNVVEFKTKIQNGVIQIPEIYKGELDGESVKVIVLKQTKQAAVDIIDELMEHPVEFDWPPLTREEIYDREL